MKLEQLKGLYARLDASRSKEEADDVLKEFKTLCESLTEDEKLEYRDEILKIVCQRLDSSMEAVRVEKRNMAIEYNGNRYQSPEWITVASYARLYGTAVQTVFNWIKRGNIPKEDSVIIPELNNLKLIRNKKYELRRYQLSES